ncbi:MAG: transcriptional regulator [Spirochaetes bacterium RIFOXYB1_FULL_32_8]|nr:MAG: transcriptional regulator [Spirochaetes bacterium GWE1_32_154]OHD48407.1 MAG: transcriptional regulator [Spirochaetes bacterium GWE2_31_10]OHD83069.1 MAG: transcriptional regulator [Spirochaetes bacterium RIFOXYB1_FULL_32_8]HBI38237.1 YebC/PmpR family DNA-binding transcriptional regulator [Spirochaetia bacterium]
MSGHSKWANIQHKKGANDKKRASIFTKIIRELSVAAKIGGSSAESNPRLRAAILKAKEANMPKDTMEKAIKKGAGELESSHYDEFTYEGYGPDGVAIYMEIMTDNKNRTSSDVKSSLAKNGGNLGANGCVSYIFHKKGVILFDIAVISEEKAFEIGIDSGADDVVTEDDNIIVYTNQENFEAVLKAFDDNNIAHISAEITMVPDTYQVVSADKVDKVIALIDKLEDLDDIQAVYTNLKIPDDYNG